MKNILRRLQRGGVSHDDQTEGSSVLPKSWHRPIDASSSSSSSDFRTMSSFSGWLNVAKNSLYQGGTSKKEKDENSNEKCRSNDEFVMEEKTGNSSSARKEHKDIYGASHTAYPLGKCSHGDSQRAESEVDHLASDQATLLQDEELQLRVALALSAREDPEATAIEATKDLSLGSESASPFKSTAEVLSYRYWKYDALNFDDKVLDGFYDVYGIACGSASETMPALLDLQDTQVSDTMMWEVVSVNRTMDSDLIKLEQKVVTEALECKSAGLTKCSLAHKIACIVADQMGGSVIDEGLLHGRWHKSSAALRISLGNVVLPLGRLEVGLGRHRALLFKVLADAVSVPCGLLKGKHYTGNNEGAVSIIKVDGRDYIVDLMRDPGTLLPWDTTFASVSYPDPSPDKKELIPEVRSACGDGAQRNIGNQGHHDLILPSKTADSSGGAASYSDQDPVNLGLYSNANESCKLSDMKKSQTHPGEASKPVVTEAYALPIRPNSVRTVSHLRSPSWTEGVSSPTFRDMKVKDVSQFMMDAAKENPNLAQKLHDVLVESGINAPLDLFVDISPKKLQTQLGEERSSSDETQEANPFGGVFKRKEKSSASSSRLSDPSYQGSSSEDCPMDDLSKLSSMEGFGDSQSLDQSSSNVASSISQSSLAWSGGNTVQSSGPMASSGGSPEESLPSGFMKHVPVAAAAAATAAVVASSMVAAAAKSVHVLEPTLEVPVAAAATASAAVVAATSAVVGRRSKIFTTELAKEDDFERDCTEDADKMKKADGMHGKGIMHRNKELEGSASTDKCPDDTSVSSSDNSAGSLSLKSDKVLKDVSEWEIPWEDLVIGERIGLGSNGEVYHADWNGTEVAVKKFLDQDITGDALEVFRSEVQLMTRMRHPNVVLFMGAVTRAPNMSIVTEFLPRGSLYRLIHRSNTQLDERRRMRMALDVARGMNYLHNCTPVIVHRDLKSPNLLVDKNWVVKVCDFGLSRMKHNTFLSSKSTAGTPEWMAPEVLRNEPSNEKCDVYSFGVILWELATLQQPWAGMNPMQVVGAIGFQQRMLDIPDELDPDLVRIIKQCWQSDPAVRPSFTEIMAALKRLQKSVTRVRSSKS
ncbi:hypothetical protein KP509_04G068100 [Ceratopteris richardii]|uniref:non-specific serine/threonine protein kinase n=3 Tax=Ceratopteris richardii TaxID=49495 RepID=A0A8T2UTV2_CERRI|nr:hypothetical protein KP509_04G068100 [Ceratopteris richardii]